MRELEKANGDERFDVARELYECRERLRMHRNPPHPEFVLTPRELELELRVEQYLLRRFLGIGGAR